jgi:hypothetical protein
VVRGTQKLWHTPRGPHCRKTFLHCRSSATLSTQPIERQDVDRFLLHGSGIPHNRGVMMHKFLSRMSVAAVLLAASGSALAVTQVVPEPGILELVAVAAVVGFIARKRRK